MLIFCVCITLPVPPSFCQDGDAQQAAGDSQDELKALGAPEGQYSIPNRKLDITIRGGIQPGIDVPPGGISLHTSAGTLRLEPGQAGRPAKAAAGSQASDNPSRIRPYVIFVTGLTGLYLIISLVPLVFPGLARKPAKEVIVLDAGSQKQAIYPIIRVLGQGGMGVVYEAHDRVLDRKVAIKKMREEIRDSVTEREYLIREAKTVAKLHHPAIVDIYSIVEQGNDLYLVFEFVDGNTVAELLKKKGRFSLAETKDLLKPVSDALDFAHGNNVIHRDLKPSNVMVTELGFVKVMDFGLARQAEKFIVKEAPVEARTELASCVAGTPLYMSPEAERGMVCRESDIYSLGVMTFEMLTGSVPFPVARTAGVKAARNYTKPSETVPGLSEEVDLLIADMLHPDPDKRPHSAGEFWRRLASIC